MGSSKSSESTSYSGSGQKWAQPYAMTAARSVQNTFNRNQGQLEQIAGKTGGLFGVQTDKFNQGIEGANAARGYGMDVLSGKYLGGNPHLESIIAKSRGGVKDAVNSNFATAGRYGSASHAGTLAEKLGEMESGLRYNDYAGERNQMGGAAQMLAGMNSSDLQQALAAAGVTAEIPYTGTSHLANSLGALFSGGTQKSVSYAPNPIWGAVGAGLGAAGAYFSDRRLKKDIERVGEFADGLGIYNFRYRNDPTATLFKGVMADEVKQLRPQAYIPNYRGSGFDGVNYGAL